MRFVGALLIILAGCAGTDKLIEDARAAGDHVGLALQADRALIIALCKEPSALPRPTCDQMQANFNTLQSAYVELLKAIP